MLRRNFFGVTIGALLARFLPRPTPVVPMLPIDAVFVYHPIEGGIYKPGDPFVISRQRVIDGTDRHPL